jgi:DNA/RNA endonuclease YhcR with UshA esterase domain
MKVRNQLIWQTIFTLFLVSLVAVAAIIVPTVSYAAPATANVISIAAARGQVGQEVSVEGSVTVPSGTFESATFDKGFAIQDDTAGIYVSIATDLKLNFHRKVRVTGVVQDDGFGLLILKVDNPANVEVLPGAKQIKAQEFATGDLGESTEGSLVTVVGTVSQPLRDDRPFGFGVFLDDGSGEIQVFIHVTSGINPFKIPFVQPGQRIKVTGFSGQFQEFIEVSPRIRGDIQHIQK